MHVIWSVLLCLGLGVGLTGCSDTGIRACFGDAALCDRFFGRNQPPVADAGADQTVAGGDRVTLDGSASHDPDGSIASYSWTQQEGPVVAIEDADRAIAAFDAPDVAEVTTLRFRLVVTDDRGASDSDRTEVSVVPAATLALQHGVTLLAAAMAHASRHAELTCADCAARLGLWLGARALAAEAGADPSVDDLLDTLRTLTRVDSERLRQAPLTPEARRLFEFGHAEIARFTTWRDPATAERAVALAGATASIDDDAWPAAMLAAEPGLARLQDAGPAELSRWLRRKAADTSPAETAAAVILLLRAEAQPPTHPDR